MTDRFERDVGTSQTLAATPFPTSPIPRAASLSSKRRRQPIGRPRRHAAFSSFVALGILVILVAAALVLSAEGKAPLSLSLVFGSAFGLVLQRSRFCFYCAIREWLEEREPGGILGLITAAGVGSVGYALVFGAWMPDPSTGRLPPDAFIGPLSWTLVLGGLAFGAGMAISGSCISAHLYRLGEGSPTAPFALLGTLIGFGLGFASWNALYLAEVAEAPTLWLPALAGYAGFLGLTLLALLALAWAPLLWSMRSASPANADAAPHAVSALAPLRAAFFGRWPGWIGGAPAFSWLRALVQRRGDVWVGVPLQCRSGAAAVVHPADRGLPDIPQCVGGCDH
ncbi:MAG: YeeE/YedE family protein [Rhizobiaceae bacterium]|nr:YeeE/YedE family protein [Rhizobiaceae bacterium]